MSTWERSFKRRLLGNGVSEKDIPSIMKVLREINPDITILRYIKWTNRLLKMTIFLTVINIILRILM